MRMILTYNFKVLLLLMSGLGGLMNLSHAQSHYDTIFNKAALKNAENLLVFTDRSIYAVNESIRFSAILQSGGKPYHGLGSKVMYAELVNSNGNAIAKGKYLIDEYQSGGTLSIPSTLLSGNYFLRCYTRWMRNFGPRSFAYVPIQLVNPYSSEVEEINPDSGKNDLILVPKGRGIVSTYTTRRSYHSKDTVRLELSLMEGPFTRIQQGCITVVPLGAIDTAAFHYKVDWKPVNTTAFQFNYLPERNGTSLSGSVIDPGKQKPAPDRRIHFSILGEDPAYFVTHSDQQGRFLINTPLRVGNQEMFVIPEFLSDNPLEVRIDNDFTTEPLPFQPASFFLSPDEHLLASRLSLNMQLQRAFLSESGTDKVAEEKRAVHIPFYGTPEISVKLDDFISLPNMEEVIENLIPMTFVMHHAGGAYIMIKNENPMISLFPPLILIDHIPVFDIEVIMAIQPSKIALIEVVPEVYVKGEVKYGGIINFTTLQGDLAGISLPEGSYFFDYDAFQPLLNPLQARYSGGNLPDTRNTLFWMDHLELEKGASRTLSFQAASVPGTYLILFRGVSSDGTLVHGLNSFEVE